MKVIGAVCNGHEISNSVSPSCRKSASRIDIPALPSGPTAVASRKPLCMSECDHRARDQAPGRKCLPGAAAEETFASPPKTVPTGLCPAAKIRRDPKSNAVQKIELPQDRFRIFRR